jgi:hypothetical protein
MAVNHFGTALIEYRQARANFEHVASTAEADESRAAGTASDNALGRLIAAPSSTVADLATKLETMLVEYQDSEWDEDRVRLIAADARRLAKTPEQTAWWALVDRLAAVEASQPVSQESIDEAGDLIGQIMTTPAPDAAAVRWKLDYILDTSGGSSASYAADYLQQLVADYRRALGEA